MATQKWLFALKSVNNRDFAFLLFTLPEHVATTSVHTPQSLQSSDILVLIWGGKWPRPKWLWSQVHSESKSPVVVLAYQDWLIDWAVFYVPANTV